MGSARSSVLFVAACTLAAGVVLGAGVTSAVSQCAAVLPAPLRTFCPGTPARASDINANFAQLVAWIEGKVGPVGQPTAIVGEGTVRATRTGGAGGTYARSLGRQVFEAPFNPAYAALNTASSTTAIPSATLAQYCGDEDGCLVRLLMQDWDAARGDASSAPVHFAYDATTGSVRVSDVVAPTHTYVTYGWPQGTDNDGALFHLVTVWNCYFTDGRYTPGAAGHTDTNDPGLWLLNWNRETIYQPKCQLIIDD